MVNMFMLIFEIFILNLIFYNLFIKISINFLNYITIILYLYIHVFILSYFFIILQILILLKKYYQFYINSMKKTVIIITKE